MPKSVYKTETTPAFDYALDELERFANPDEWRTSKKGNLWRHWEGLTVTIFERDDETFGWVISDEDGPRYSRQTFDTEEEAIEVLAEELEVGI